MDFLIEKLKTFPQDEILEVGTGKGQFIPDLKKIFSGYRKITGIDPDARSVQTATEFYKAEAAIEFLHMNSEAMTFEDHRFDVVGLSNTLHHLPPGHLVFKEIKRVLKPGGLLFVIELYHDNQNEKQNTHVMQHHFRAEVDTRNGIFHDFTFERAGIVNYLQSHQVTVNETFDYNDPVRMNSENQKNRETVLNGIAAATEATRHFPDHEHFKNRAEEIIHAIHTTGFMMPSQLIALCTFQDL